ncbi:hypothetical protein FRC19_001398 [Serendipita sp. 401]|nr:hypothetical protein FRC19_001398 [Serendipita sp. 401]KAG9055674.1 hypothetical protein FS842_001531 [Serendipita sp. 407]
MQQVLKKLVVPFVLLSLIGHSVAVPTVTPITPEVINITARSTSLSLGRRAEPEESYSYSLIGCYDEMQYPVRVLNHQIVDWDKKDITSCVKACFNSGPPTGLFGPHHLFAGVVNGDQCWCDSAMNVNAQRVDQNRCNHLCANNPEYYCGGSREYQLYFFGDTGLNPVTLNPAQPPSVGQGTGYYQFKGCWRDDPSNRIFRGSSYAGPEVTPLYCSHLCWAHGFLYSGVEFGRECFCDNTLERAGSAVSPTNCNQACEFDSTLACGAPNYLQIYQANTRRPGF